MSRVLFSSILLPGESEPIPAPFCSSGGPTKTKQGIRGVSPAVNVLYFVAQFPVALAVR